MSRYLNQDKDYKKFLQVMQLKKLQRKPIKNTKIGRNDPCPCNSGLKYKKCCITK